MSPCPRLFEAEAMRDGRLTGADRASFERHVAMCPACSREVQALEALMERLRASAQADARDELHVRRERTRLLAAFDRALVTPQRHRASRRFVLPAVAAAISLAVLVLWRERTVPPPPVAAAAVVHADGDAIWSSRMDGSRERVVLAQGALWIHVDHSSERGRLVVALPDGELEDTGTTFRVTADNGRTTRVAVQEGSVVLRLRGQSPIAVGAGDVWTPPAPPAAASACASAAPSSEPSSSAPPRFSAATASAPPLPYGAPASSGLRRDASSDFRGAMAALDRGDNREAAAGFASFLAKYPRDPKAEDAAYLRAIALERWGDRSAMKAAALEYLARYPTGFRRIEMDNLAR
jgi:hypothetical protein